MNTRMTLHRHFAFYASLLPALSALAASDFDLSTLPNGSGDLSAIVSQAQIDSIAAGGGPIYNQNVALISQTGNNNFASIDQAGNGNFLAITQIGNNNYASMAQTATATGSYLAISQIGDNNYTFVDPAYSFGSLISVAQANGGVGIAYQTTGGGTAIINQH